MSATCSRSFVLCCGLIYLGASKGLGAEALDLSASELVCGPRCVRFLLEYYGKGKDTELVELIRETQWPDLERGASLAALSKSLEGRGIYTHALRLPAEAGLRWPFPVILHLQGVTPGDSAGGHYVVWLPESSPSRTLVISGLDQLHEGPFSRLSQRMSGYVLLTSNRPIQNPQSAILRSGLERLAFWAVCGGGLGLSVICLVARARFGPARPRVLSRSRKEVC